MHSVFQFLLLVSTAISLIEARAWHYDGEDNSEPLPAQWGDPFPECAASQPYQSPINIDYLSTVAEPDCGRKISIKNGLRKWTVKNTGYVVNLYPIGAKEPEVVFEGASDEYCLRVHHFHFHWGNSPSQGSEHSLDGTFYPAEAHIVTHVCNQTLTEALQHRNVRVFGVMMKQVETEAESNKVVREIVGALTDHLPEPDNTSTAEPNFNIEDVLPVSTDRFYRYQGALTTPPCTQGVTWTLFEKVVGITKTQLDKLRQMKFDTGKPMLGNFRPVQEVNTRFGPFHVPRKIFRCFESRDAAAHTGVLNGLLLGASLVVLSFWRS